MPTVRRTLCTIYAHAGAWHISCVQAMVTACDLKMSTHRWCTFGITTELFHPSAVTHRCASTFAWQCTPCQCPPSAEHVHDLALRDKTCTSHRRHNCEVKAMANLLRSAWACVSMSGKPADSTNLEPPEVFATIPEPDIADLQPMHHEVSDASRPSDGSASQEVSLTVQSTEENTTHNSPTEPVLQAQATRLQNQVDKASPRKPA